ncbi:MAG: succinate dehydrogenase assembly factor 2 [Nitrococcus mobilis]|nr:succinate dehydrogenase assembly factor 2 [Nitrococcus mobilis]
MSEIARLRWRCRRGTRELEYLLQRFLDHHVSLAEPDLRAFERLLDCEDDRLIDWLIRGDDPADERLCAIIRRMRRSIGC